MFDSVSEPMKARLKSFRDREVALALAAQKPAEVKVDMTPVADAIAKMASAIAALPAPQVKSYNDVKASPVPVQVKAEGAKVTIDMKPVADAVEKIGGVIAGLVAAMDKQSKDQERRHKEIVEALTNRPKRRVKIVHGDKEDSLEEV